jgi:molybdopterin synthase sulfur carrier subunit
MSISLEIPHPLDGGRGCRKILHVDGATLDEVIKKAEQLSPGLRRYLCDETGKIEPYIRLFLNGRAILDRQSSSVAVQDGDVVSVVVPVAGG